MNSRSKYLLFGVTLAVLSGCNSGGSNLTYGNICPSGYDVTGGPIAPKPSSSQKLVWNKTGGPVDDLKAGKYTYAHGDIFYKETSTPTNPPLYLQLIDTADGNGASQKPGVVCGRNARPMMNGIVGKTLGITDIIICKSGRRIFKQRQFTFSINNGALKWIAPTPAETVGDLNDAFRDSSDPSFDKIQDAFFVQNSVPTSYEFHSSMTTQTGAYNLNTTMNYSACPGGGDCPECSGSAAP